MTQNKPQIMLVDDSPIDIQITLECLREEFLVAVATTGVDAIDMIVAGQVAPIVILLDVTMPGLNGYETCQRIRNNPDTAHLEVIFLSASSSIDEKLKGYEAGGNDYLTKPVVAEELLRKVRLAVGRDLLRQESEEQAKTAMETAMSAIMDAGDQANVVHFLQSSFQCGSAAQLAELIVSASENFELSNSVQIRTNREIINRSTSQPMPPLEIEMLQALSDSGRIIQRGRRLILNFGNISQLVKNMPIEDEDKCGRYRDHLALILEGACSRLNGLMVLDQLNALMHTTNESIRRIREQQTENKKQSVTVMDDLFREIDTNFVHYGLTDLQERVLMDIVHTYSEKAFLTYEQGLQVDDELQAIANQITTVIQTGGRVSAE